MSYFIPFMLHGNTRNNYIRQFLHTLITITDFQKGNNQAKRPQVRYPRNSYYSLKLEEILRIHVMESSRAQGAGAKRLGLLRFVFCPGKADRAEQVNLN
jgi:hypothetical protein